VDFLVVAWAAAKIGAHGFGKRTRTARQTAIWPAGDCEKFGRAIAGRKTCVASFSWAKQSSFATGREKLDGFVAKGSSP